MLIALALAGCGGVVEQPRDKAIAMAENNPPTAMVYAVLDLAQAVREVGSDLSDIAKHHEMLAKETGGVAVAITAGASASAGTSGTSSGASGGKNDATTKTRTGYEKGLASFSIIKGGLMYEAALGGAKFKYDPL